MLFFYSPTSSRYYQPQYRAWWSFCPQVGSDISSQMRCFSCIGYCSHHRIFRCAAPRWRDTCGEILPFSVVDRPASWEKSCPRGNDRPGNRRFQKLYSSSPSLRRMHVERLQKGKYTNSTPHLFASDHRKFVPRTDRASNQPNQWIRLCTWGSTNGEYMHGGSHMFIKTSE